MILQNVDKVTDWFTSFSGNNSCTYLNGGCAEICLFNSQNTVTCACTYGKLDKDNKNCIGVYLF